MVTVRNKVDIIQETSESHTMNDKYENFVTIDLKETAQWMPPKPRAKCRVP